MIALTMTWLIASQPVMAMEYAGQTVQLASGTQTDPRAQMGEDPLFPFGADRIDRLGRSRLVEIILVVAVGTAAAVTGAAMGGLTFAIATGVAGVYVMLSLP